MEQELYRRRFIRRVSRTLRINITLPHPNGHKPLYGTLPNRKCLRCHSRRIYKQMQKEFDQVRDFIILHYVATERDDSPFWNYCRTMSIPDSLKEKINLFQEAGRIFRYNDELFSKPSWIAVCLGQNIVPKTKDPIVSSLPFDQVNHSLNSMHRAMVQAAENMTTHEAFLKQYGAAIS